MNMDVQHLSKEGDPHTAQAIIDGTSAQVESFLQDIAPDYVSFSDGSFTVNQGSASIMIVVRQFTRTEAMVECIANVVSGAEMSDKLLTYLLRKNSELHFGAFGLLFDKTICFSYSLPSSQVNRYSLETALHAVAVISDYYDDEIVAMSGGQRAADVKEIEE